MRDGVPVKYRSTSDRLEADDLENLRTLVALQRGNAHLGEGLQQPLVDGLHVVLENLVPGILHGKRAVAVQVFECFDRQVRVYGARAIAQQQRKMHHFAGLAGLDDQRDLVARFFANQMIVHGGKRQQAGNRRMPLVHAAIGENQQRVAGLDGQRSALAQRLSA